MRNAKEISIDLANVQDVFYYVQQKDECREIVLDPRAEIFEDPKDIAWKLNNIR